MTITAQEVIQAQAHIGTLKSEAHPKTNKYRAEVHNGIVVINPEIIAQQISAANAKVQEAKKESKEILVISEKKMIADELAALCEGAHISYLSYKQPG